jgi:hypothetical protein
MSDVPSPRPQNQGASETPVNLEPALPVQQESLKQQTNDVTRLTLCVTDQDYYWSDKSGLRNPILCALQQSTSTLWHIYEDGFALEAMPPYRACQLPTESLKKWRCWLMTGQMESPQWEIELVDTKEQHGYSLIQFAGEVWL